MKSLLITALFQSRLAYRKIVVTVISCFCLLSISFFPMQANASNENIHKNNNIQLYDQYPWSLMYYYGITASDALVRIAKGSFHRWPEHIQSLELAYTLSEQNFLRRLVHPLVGVVQLAGNVTLRNGSNEHTIYEFDPYLMFRWTNFPWNHYVTTSLAIGEGISYDTSVPALEKKYNTNTKRLLNYLMLEATFAYPHYPRWQLVARIHHRSGAYGLYHAGNTGSNDVGLGIRYLFD